jgi:prevent-host-death family protein
MFKTISSSELRAQLKRVLNEVGYGQTEYVVEKSGEPTAAIISMADFELLQAAKQQQAASSLPEVVAKLRQRGQAVDLAELTELIEAARTEFYRGQGQTTYAD